MIDWQKMLNMHQELNQFARIMLVKKQKEFLTSSERELLAWIYLTQDDCTPLYLSKVSGMKKEAVSRSLKALYEKGCIKREKKSTDERSYCIYLTDDGNLALLVINLKWEMVAYSVFVIYIFLEILFMDNYLFKDFI